jgi:hypothetical protein
MINVTECLLAKYSNHLDCLPDRLSIIYKDLVTTKTSLLPDTVSKASLAVSETLSNTSLTISQPTAELVISQMPPRQLRNHLNNLDG